MTKYHSPVEIYPCIITQYFSLKHNGLDIRSFNQSKIFLIEDAFIVRTSFSNGVDKFGNHFIVCHGTESGLTYRYIHNKPVNDLLPGQEFSSGYVIGHTEIGGNSKAAHLHLSISDKDDNFLNPLDILKDFGLMTISKKEADNAK